jgi:polyphosphate kinase
MPRNLYERVEVMFPLLDPALCRQVCTTVLAPYFADTEKTRFLLPDGAYERARKTRVGSQPGNGTRFNVQEFLIDVAEGHEEHGMRAHLTRFLKQQSSPVFDLLSTNWDEIQNG